MLSNYSRTISTHLNAGLKTNRPAITMMMTRVMSTDNGVHRVLALCKANSELLGRNIQVMDNLINKHHINGANKIYKTKCPITGTSLGRQFRHEIENFEKVALDGLTAMKDQKEHQPIDLHYDDHTEVNNMVETDICEARERYVFVQNVFESVSKLEQMEGDLDLLDGDKTLTANFNFPCGKDGKELMEFPLTSTLEREMGFVCHHAIHHNKIIKAMARAGKVGLTMDDIPTDFGRAPIALEKELEDHAA